MNRAKRLGRPPRRPDGIQPVLRMRARRRALQAIYAWQISGGQAKQILAQFAHEQAIEVADLSYFECLVAGVITSCDQIDVALTPYLDRAVGSVAAIERAVLRLAAYELLHRPDVPYRVVINEAIETAKRFGSDQGHTYVNGVLDRAALTWRSVEAQQAQRESAAKGAPHPKGQ